MACCVTRDEEKKRRLAFSSPADEILLLNKSGLTFLSGGFEAQDESLICLTCELMNENGLILFSESGKLSVAKSNEKNEKEIARHLRSLGDDFHFSSREDRLSRPDRSEMHVDNSDPRHRPSFN